MYRLPIGSLYISQKQRNINMSKSLQKIEKTDEKDHRHLGQIVVWVVQYIYTSIFIVIANFVKNV